MNKLLIVENNVDFAYVIDWHFQSLGMTVFSVTDGSEALKIHDSERPDAILLDINLDGEMDGKEVARKIRTKDLATPIIFMSGETNSPKDVAESHTIGCSYFLKKPISIKELEIYIKEVLKTTEQGEYKLNNTIVNFNNRTVVFGSKTEYLSDKENQVLHLLIGNLGKVVPLEMFLKTIWNGDLAENTLRNKISEK